ncbi:YbhB/YbcL family Raf kinase inhibitor-like protein [Paenalcaligenes sp. Me131]|uniref:YbhB/YbcL family Raf kinase inhibitor-like protein n=1 Tax=Paenalcaligenes sp. Me131 TaxID=3392636 RepID=UPI003D2A3AB7
MKLRSDSFTDQAVIPERLAFGRADAATKVALAGNANPHLAWEDVPEGTRSFVVLCVDPDVPAVLDDVNQPGKEVDADTPRVDFYHWVLVDIPADSREVSEGVYSDRVTPRGKAGPLAPGGTRQGLNDYSKFFAHDHDMSGDYFGYDGPCPPWNDALQHRYTFTIYALDLEELPLEGKFGGAEVKAAMQGHILAQASLTGTYTLNEKLL